MKRSAGEKQRPQPQPRSRPQGAVGSGSCHGSPATLSAVDMDAREGARAYLLGGEWQSDLATVLDSLVRPDVKRMLVAKVSATLTLAEQTGVLSAAEAGGLVRWLEEKAGAEAGDEGK